MSFFQQFWENVLATSGLEWFAVITGILYVIFAARQMMICWLFAFVSSGSFVVLCVWFGLYLESLLQCFYVVMAIVGWLSWKGTKTEKTASDLIDASDNRLITVRTWRFQNHLINIILSGGIAFLLGWFFKHFTNQMNPFTDAFTTVFSLAATFMVTQKVLENWIYWIVIDLVSIPLYGSRGLYLSAVLYVVFTVLAVAGFVSWYRKLKMQTA